MYREKFDFQVPLNVPFSPVDVIRREQATCIHAHEHRIMNGRGTKRSKLIIHVVYSFRKRRRRKKLVASLRISRYTGA